MSNGHAAARAGGDGGVVNREAARAPAAKGRRGRKLLLWGGGGLLVVVGLAVALAPTIGSALAPGMIEGSVNPGIKGRVKVGKASIGWFSGLAAGPVEVFDPQGERVASASVAAPVTVWQAVSGRYWSASRLDLGTIEVRGSADIKQYLDGTTSLDRAFSPREGAPAKPAASGGGGGGGGGSMPAVKATLKVTELNVTVRDEKDQFKSELGLKDFKGEAKVDADLGASGGGVVKASADFSGRAVSPGAAAGESMNLKLDADVKQTSADTWSPDGIAQAKVNLALSNAPMRVIDALAGMGGAIVQGVGESADVNVNLDGNAQAMSGRVTMNSTGLNADATVSIKDGVLTAAAAEPSTVSLKSAAFVENLPQARAGVAKAGEQIRLSSAPSVQVVLEKLSVPLPKGSGADIKTLDLRGATVGLKVKVSEMAGQVKLPGAAGGGADAAAGTWKPFSVSPIELAIDIPDLSKPVNIQTGTRATLDGQPAGEISLAVSAEGLLNKDGRLRAMLGGGEAMADKASTTARVTGMSTALLQPIIAGAVKDLPVDLAIDVGPSLDLVLTANADVGGAGAGAAAGEGLAALPPADIDAQVNSRNIQAAVKGRLDKGVLTSPGEGVRLTVAQASPLAQRIVAASQKDAAAGATKIALSGAGKVELIGRDLSLPLAGGGADAILSKGKGEVSLVLSDVNAAVDMGAGGSAAPVRIERHAVNLTLTPGAGPKVALDGQLSHENQPFTITGGYALNGLSKGMPQTKGPGVLAAVNPTGTVEVKGLPRSLLAIVPATAGYASSAGVAADATEMTRAIAGLVRETMGSSADVSLRLLAAAPDIGGGQLAEVTVATPGKGLGLNTWARVSASEAELRLLNTFVRLTPESSNGVLRAMTAPAAKPGEPATAAEPMRLGAPVVLRVLVDKPVKVPLAAGPDGAVTPDWSKAGVLAAKIAAESDVVVDNVAIGAGTAGGAARPTVLALRGVQADITAPLAGVPESARASQRASVKLNAQALNRTAGEALIAKLAADASAMMNGSSPEAVVKVTDVGGVAVGDLLAMRDKFVGAVGETAEASVTVKPGAAGAGTVGEVIEVVMEVTSPRISGAKLSLAKDDQRLWLTAPSTVTWTPNVAMLNELISAGTETAPPQGQRPRGGGGQAGAAAAGSGFTIEQMQPISVNIERLGVGMGATDASGQPTAGPLKPGVFEVGLSARAPSMNALVATGQPGQPPTKLAIEGLSVSVSSAKAAANAAGPNPVELNLNVDRIGGVGATTGKRSTARVQVANLADARGVVNGDAAVVDADIDIESFPTPIVDKLANQGGIMTELLGPTVTLKAQGRNVSSGGGTGAPAAAGNLSVQATSQRATSELKGDIKGGRFVQSGPVKVVIREIRNELVKALAGSVPIIETLEKTPPDEPATIETSGLMVPLDNDLRKLNGRVAVDMGIARFTTNSLLGDLIKGLGGRQSGSIGKKVEPFVVNIKDGVATYERFRLPVGEFFLETRGTVDLVNRQMDVVTYAPIGALTDKAIGKLGAPITGRLNEVLQVPFTTKGSLDNPQRVYPDVGLFLKEAGENIIKDPGKIIGDVIGDVFKPKEPKK